MSLSVPMIEVWRGDFLESQHSGHAVVCDSRGGIIESWGNPNQVILPRSACKMLQALPLIESGAAEKFKRLYSIYNENRDLMVMGGYVRGSDPELDQAIDIKSKIDDYLKQKPDESVNFEDSKNALSTLMG